MQMQNTGPDCHVPRANFLLAGSCTPYKGLYTFRVCKMYPLGTWQSGPVLLCIVRCFVSGPLRAQRNCMLFKFQSAVWLQHCEL